MEPKASDSRPKGSMPRRTVMKGAAWAVPAVIAVTSVPAFAASPLTTLTGTGWTSAQRCGVITGTSFCATQSGSPAPAGLSVLVTLPTGMQFVEGGSTRTLTTGAGGCVTVPEFVTTGSAGDYSQSVRGEIVTARPAAIAYIGGEVTVNPGVIVELRSNFASGSGGAATTAVRTTGRAARAGASSGNDVGNSLAAAVLSSGVDQGKILFWYGNASWANGSTPTLHTLGTVTNATMVDTYTINSAQGRTGGVAAGGTGLWQWNAALNSPTPTVKPVTLPTGAGTILEVAAFPLRCYVRTTNGIYYWPTVTDSTSTAAIGLTNPSHRLHSGATIGWSPYYDTRNSSTNRSGDVTGVAYINSSGQLSVQTFTAAGAVAGIGNIAQNVAQVAAGSAGLMAVTTNGTMYTFANYGTPATAGDRIAPTGWTQRATNVTNVTAWGISGYFGGLYLQNGTVKQVFGKGTFTTREDISGLAGKTITQIYSSDGAYMLLTSGGQVWYWFGNNDQGVLTARQLANTGTVVDLSVWANHPGNYFAGAFAIQASSCP